MALYIAKNQKFRAGESARGIGGRPADLRPSRAIAQSIDRLGQLITFRAEEMKQERDAAVAGDLYNQFRDADREKIGELISRKGKDAINLDADYDEFFNKSLGEADKAAENGSQQTIVNNMLSKRREHSLDILARYEAQEAENYKAEQGDGLLSNAIDDARNNPFDIADINESLQGLNDWVSQAYPGMGVEDRAQLDRENKERILAASMEGQIDRIGENPEVVFSNLKAWKKDLGESYAPLKAAATKEQKVDIINKLQAELQVTYQEKGVPNFGGMRKALSSAKGVANDIKFEVRQWIDAYEVQYKSNVKNAVNTAAAAEDREIGNKFLDGDYPGVLRLVRASQALTGTEKRVWGNAVKAAQKQVDEPIDHDVQTAEMVEINRMMSVRRPSPFYKTPEEIRNHIITTPNLSGTNKKQTLEKFEKKLSTELEAGRKHGYKIIDNLIIPKRSMTASVLKHPIENEAVLNGQMILDDWLNNRTAVGNPPTKREIEKRAMAIAEENRPSRADIVRAIHEERANQLQETE